MRTLENSYLSFEETEKGFQERLSEIPAYNLALSQMACLYSVVKENNETLKNVLNNTECYVEKLAAIAKPIVWAATVSALIAAKPVVGEIHDPAAKIDSVASEVLAKLQEKLPIVREDPVQLAGLASDKVKETACYAYKRCQKNCIVRKTKEGLENAVSFGELAVEICFPTDGASPEDLQELEKAEEDEDKGFLVRAENLKDKAVRRGTKRLMSLKSVQASVDSVEYIQRRISVMSEKIAIGTNYVKTRSNDAKEVISNTVEETLNHGTRLAAKQWDDVYTVTMYVPKKAVEVTGKVYVSAQEMVFAFGQVQSLNEIPVTVSDKIEEYYTNLKRETPFFEEIEEKARVFVAVPVQVLSDYMKESKLVQWIVPSVFEKETIQLVGTKIEKD